MKQKIANRPHWTRILKKRYYQQYVRDGWFEGYISFLCLDQVKEPLFVRYADENICIADHGYCWIMLFPVNSRHSVTIMLDDKDQVQQWYFDVIWLTELNDEGVPVIYDLYLDLVQLPDGRYFVLDELELLDARTEGIINDQMYEGAVEEMQDIRQSLIRGDNQIILHTDTFIGLLQNHRSDPLS